MVVVVGGVVFWFLWVIWEADDRRTDLTHATLNFAENQGRAPQLISMINSTRSAGADVTLDTYPYLPGCTTLASLLPSWVSSGGPVDTLRRLEDLTMREKIRVAVEVDGCDGGHGIPTDWDTMQVGQSFLGSGLHLGVGKIARVRLTGVL